MIWVRGKIGLLLPLLAACASSHPPPSGVVHDQITDELRIAASDRRAPKAQYPPESALLPPLVVEMPKSVEAEPRFDLSVVNAPADQVFMAIVTDTRYNMLVTPEVTGTITIKLKDVTVREALESIRELYGYEFVVRGNRITIQPNSLQTRMFQVNYLSNRRQGSTELRVTSSAISGAGTVPGATPAAGAVGATGATPAAGTAAGGARQSGGNITSRVQTSTDSDFWGSLTTALGTLVGTGDGRSVVVNPESGVIVVRALPREIRSIENYLKATQVIVERQVMLEAKIIEVTLNQEFQSGINWASFNGRSTLGSAQVGTSLRPYGSHSTIQSDGTILGPIRNTVSAPGIEAAAGALGSMVASALGKGFFGLALQTANFAALLNFLETQGSVSVLSSPRIATLNNQKAVLKVGTDELFVTNVTTSTTSTTTGSVSTPSLTLQPYFSGISLDVTPQIDEDSNITLHVHPAVSVVQEKEKVIDLGVTLGQFKLPLASSSVNETDSIVRARDGNIVVIGGLMKQEQASDRSGLPGVASAVSGTRSASLKKRELVILLKPTVIQDDRAWVKDIEQTDDRIRDLDPRSRNPMPPGR